MQRLLGLEAEGIYRKNGNKAKIRTLKKLFNQGEPAIGRVRIIKIAWAYFEPTSEYSVFFLKFSHVRFGHKSFFRVRE